MLRALSLQNPWWRTGKVPQEFVDPLGLGRPFYRRDFYALRDRLEEEKITALVGPRQVGKTTTVYQLIDWLLGRVNPSRVMFFSFDFPGLHADLDQVIRTYLELKVGKPPRRSDPRVYIFLDEIGRVPEWSRTLKGWQDLKYNIKFFVTNSSASELLVGSSESLVGRVELYSMMQLKFVDYLRFHLPEQAELVNSVSLSLRDQFRASLRRRDPSPLLESARRACMLLDEPEITRRLVEYLLKDGYPELLNKSLAESSLRLRQYLSLTLYKDVVRIFRVRNARELEDLLVYVARSSGGLFVDESASRTLGISANTLKAYMEYLRLVFLVSRSEYYSRSRAARIRKCDKVYLLNVGLLNALLGQMDESLLENREALGRVVETVVYEHCMRLRFNLGSQADLFYWRNRGEVDIVLEVGGEAIPIEVTVGKASRKLGVMEEFMRKHDSPFGIIITEKELKVGGGVIWIPLWLFLLMC